MQRFPTADPASLFRYGLAACLMVSLAGCRTGAHRAGNNAASSPNIVILFTDDQRFNTVHALGNPEISTPNMDRLVRSGTSFTRAHIQGGQHGALCAPSRAMLMTGRPLFALHEKGDVIPEEHVMMPVQFRGSGYRTFGTGKWHNNKQSFARAFDDGDNIFFGGMHWPAAGGHESAQLHHFDSTGSYPQTDRFPADKFSSTMFADAAVDFVSRQTAADPPFFLYVAFSSPHDPRTPPPPFAEAYSGKDVSLPPNFMAEHPFDNGELVVRDEMLLPHPRTREAVRRDLAAYYGMISEVDMQIGRVLDALDASGRLDNTIIVFAGDNGLGMGSHGLLGKQNLYDHSMRVPLVISGPGIPRNERRDALVYLFDLFRSLSELAGVAVPETVLGRSLVPLLRNPDTAVRDAVFYAYRDLQRGVRTNDNWKLIEYEVAGVSHVQLFNLNTDPDELDNLAGDPAHGQQLSRLRQLLLDESRANFDPLDLTAPNWGKAPPERAVSVKHLAVGKAARLTSTPSPDYPGAGSTGLVDGIRCTSDFKADCWLGFEGTDLDATIDLGEVVPVKQVSGRFMRNIGAWIFLPTRLDVSVSSNGEIWEAVGSVEASAVGETDATEARHMYVRFAPRGARFIRITGASQRVCPPWHSGAGEKAWLFIDEIEVR